MDIKDELKTTAELEVIVWGPLVAPCTFQVDIKTDGQITVTTIPESPTKNDGHKILEYCLKDIAEACSAGREIPDHDLRFKVMIDAKYKVTVEESQL